MLNVYQTEYVLDDGCIIVQLVKAKLVESHVFLTLELDGNIDVYFERRRTVLQVKSTYLKYCTINVCIILQRLELIKLQLRQQSKDGNSQEKVEIVSLSPEQAVSLPMFLVRIL